MVNKMIAFDMVRLARDENASILAEVKTDGGYIVASCFGYSDSFYETIKTLGMDWDKGSKAWLNYVDGERVVAEDRSAEVAHRLVEAGFAVLTDSHTSMRVQEKNYKPMVERWIDIDVDSERFVVFRDWDSYDVYRDLTKIQDAIKGPGRIFVPVVMWRELCDVANEHGYAWSIAAHEVYTALEKEDSTVIIIDGKALRVGSMHQNDQTGEIDARLRDDD